MPLYSSITQKITIDATLLLNNSKNHFTQNFQENTELQFQYLVILSNETTFLTILLQKK